VAALQGYRDGTRQHPTMQAQASSMSDEDMQDLAAYFSSIGNETVAAGGSETAGIEAASAGQHQDYLKHALNQYRDGTRKNPVMAQMAAPLTDDDVAVLVRYYSSLEGLETTVVE
jgi:cytochrome c553